MKQLITIIFFAFILSCSNTTEQHPIEGTWKCDDTKKGCVIIFKNGFYSITRWNDDVVNTSQGKYFFNENQARQNITLTLIPDLQFSEGDTIILPCENIDVVSITDSILITQKPTQWVHGIGGGRIGKNFTELYKKIKQ